MAKKICFLACLFLLCITATAQSPSDRQDIMYSRGSVSLVETTWLWFRGLIEAPDLRVWHRATAAECHAETQRQYKAMWDLGWSGDPPITMGMAMYGIGPGGKLTGYSDNPCGYTDGYRFRHVYIVFLGDHDCEVTTVKHISGAIHSECIKEELAKVKNR